MFNVQGNSICIARVFPPLLSHHLSNCTIIPHRKHVDPTLSDKVHNSGNVPGSLGPFHTWSLACRKPERNQGRSEPWGKLAPKWDGPLKVDQHLGVDPQVCLKIGYPNILEQIRASPTGPSLRHRSRKWGMIYNNLLCIRINKEIYIYI